MSTQRVGVLQQRSELSFLLPVALVTLALLSSFTLFAYRDAVDRWHDQRLGEAERLARRVASELATRPLPSADELRRFRLPGRITILDSHGLELVSSEDFPASRQSSTDIGLDLSASADSVSAEALFQAVTRRLTARVDLPAPALRGRQRSLRILLPVVLTVNALMVLLVLAFIGRFLAPFDRMLERASSHPELSPGGDEEEVMLAAFDKALEVLAGSGAPPEAEDLEVLQRTFAHSMESGVLLCDHQRRVLALNDVGSSILGIAPPEPGRSLERVLASHGELLAGLRQSFEDALVQRQECTIEVEGKRRELGFTRHTLRRDDGEVRGFLTLFTDLTSVRREADRERLTQSLSQVGELAAGMAHEMRNSLATLSGYLTLVERGGKADSMGDYVRELRRETDHIKRVLEDFLTFARPGSVRVEEVDLRRLLHRAAADPALGGYPVKVIGKGSPPALVGDPQLLERALRNLLHNAVRAERESAAEGPVMLRWRIEDESLEVAIEDRGPGLDPDLREKLFHPFVSGYADGVGLGLALTRRIVELHGGEIGLEDRASGGTRAVVRWPRDASVTNGSNFELSRT